MKEVNIYAMGNAFNSRVKSASLKHIIKKAILIFT